MSSPDRLRKTEFSKRGETRGKDSSAGWLACAGTASSWAGPRLATLMLVIVAIITPPAELRPRYDCQPSVKQAKYATMWRLYFQIFFLSIAAWSAPAQAGEAIEYPQFRQVDKAQAKPELSLPSKITLLADEDFAPFSFKSIDGKSAGISIQLALSSCALLKLTCDVKFLPYAALLPALASKQGHVVVGGPS
ncbi:MAG TPA: hypothetical protein VII21_07015, partial [Aestuariivirga sp.]